jgi:hypothetical protein
MFLLLEQLLTFVTRRRHAQPTSPAMQAPSSVAGSKTDCPFGGKEPA